MNDQSPQQKRRRPQKIVTIVGARPQFVKSFPLSRALRASPDMAEVSLHTGQHFDRNMSDIFFTELGIAPPEHELDIHGGPQGAATGRMLGAIEEVLQQERPDAALVYGDTNSTLAGALAASKLHIPVVHVEAGLRSFNKKMPEEINRIMTDHASDLLLCPTSIAIENLRREGITKGVKKTGDLMYDATLLGTTLAAKNSRILDTLSLEPKRYAVATIHRAENTDDEDQLKRIVAFLSSEAHALPIVLPLHPRTRNAIRSSQIALTEKNIRIVAPIGFLDMCQLLHNSCAVFTDSGGVQKEAYFHRVPCVTLRNETEWVETVDHGWNRLWSEASYRPRKEIHEYGNGDAAAEIVQHLRAFLAEHGSTAA